MNVVELLDRSVLAWPDAPAIIDGAAGNESVLTFADLGERSRRIASLLGNAGLKAGDGIVLMLPMSAELYVVIAASWRLGLVPVFIDPAAGKEHVTQSLARYPVRAFVGSVSACLLRFFMPALRNIPIAFVSVWYFPGAQSLSASDRLSQYEDMHSCTSDTPAMIAFTSGSTGLPKGILRTHGLLMSTHAILSSHVRVDNREVMVATMPLLTLINLGCGVTSLIPDIDLLHPGAISVRRLWYQIKRWRVTRVGASPALLERFADYYLSRGYCDESIQAFYVGGAPVFPRLMDKLLQVAPGAKVWVLYGCTEAEPIAMISSDEMNSEDLAQTISGKGLLVGRPIPEIRLRILRDRWGSQRGSMELSELDQDTLKADEVGEIVVSGPHVVPAYLGGAGDAETKVQVGKDTWHRTGDAGRLDAEGRLWLLGRCEASIEDKAGILYPYAIEAAMSMYPAIARSAFLLHQGQRLLIIELCAGCACDVVAIMQRISWAEIDAVVTLKSIPVDRRHNAKVNYPVLRSMLNAEKWLSRVNYPLPLQRQ